MYYIYTQTYNNWLVHINLIIEFISSKELGGIGLNMVVKREYTHIFKV